MPTCTRSFAFAHTLTLQALCLGLGMALTVPKAAFASDGAKAETCRVRSGAERVPLVELYTSEGCSSCPPADRWLTRQVEAGGQGAHWLAFHVDYWDDLGWPDRFGAAAHSSRQRERVAAAGKRTVFTPQVMVGPQIAAMWRTQGPFQRSLDAQRGPARAGLALLVEPGRAGGRSLRVGSSLIGADPAARNARLWVAETRDEQFTEVRAGENAGTLLRHDRVVVRLWGPWTLGDGPEAQRIDLGTHTVSGTAWTAFVQAADGEILQSLRLEAGSCR